MLKQIIITIILVITTLPAVFGASCQRGYSGPVESITVAYSPFESTGLLWIANDHSFFTRNGLDITLRKYDTGAGALDGILKGEADIVVGTSEYPVAGKALKNEKIRIIATIDKANYIYLVGRKDRGIQKVSDLKGKRVGTTFGTLAHFYLGSLLDLNNMSMKDITLIDLKTPEEWVNAVADGDIDAVVTAQPYANHAADRLGANAYIISAQADHFLYGLAISSEDWITKHGEAAIRFLKSLVQAEGYLQSNPAAAKDIIKEELNLDTSYMETVWAQNTFSLSLDQPLILAMEDETRWIIGNNLTTEKTVPNFLDYIYSGALKAVKPDAVNIAGK
jgi:sulfonate transport system substrate-binding protein